MNIEEHLKSYNLLNFNSFDELSNYAVENWDEPNDTEMEYLNCRDGSSPEAGFIENLKFYNSIYSSDLLRSIVLSEKFGSYMACANFIENKLDESKKILDIGCGIGYLTTYYALKYPNSEFYGIDFSIEAIKHANKFMDDLKINNVEFQAIDMNQLNFKINILI